MSKELKIEKGIPIPAINISDKRERVVRKMEVGDSIVVENRNKALAAYYMILSEYGKRSASTRAQKDGTYRVWRTR